MLCEILAPIKTRNGVIEVGTVVNISQETFVKIAGRVRKHHPINFDKKHWQCVINSTVNNAMEADGGALDYCRQYRTDLHSKYMRASTALDDAYRTKNEQNIVDAIRLHNETFKAVRSAYTNFL